MSEEVQFDTDLQGMPLRRPGMPQRGAPGSSGQSVGGLSGWLIRHGLARSESAAQMILIGIILVDIIATFFVIKYFL